MPKISPYCEYIIDLLSPYGEIKVKPMFGGYGVYKDGIIVAIIADDELYFKVDHTNQQQYENYNSEAFSYKNKNKIVKMSYWKLPLEIIENEEELSVWLDQSYNISLKNKNK